MPKTKYPIFEQCSGYTLDEFWIDILHSCSVGKFPDRMRMDGPTTIVVDDYRFELDPDNPIQSFKQCMDVFKNTLNIQSAREGASQPRSTESTLDWKSLKTKSVRDFYITEYVLELQQRYGLTRADTRHLGRIIRSAILLKTIKPENIIFEHNRISDITNLRYEAKSFHVEGAIDVKLKTLTKKQKK